MPSLQYIFVPTPPFWPDRGVVKKQTKIRLCLLGFTHYILSKVFVASHYRQTWIMVRVNFCYDKYVNRSHFFVLSRYLHIVCTCTNLKEFLRVFCKVPRQILTKYSRKARIAVRNTLGLLKWFVAELDRSVSQTFGQQAGKK